MDHKTFKIYKSSAGSGKTYTLSKNYIRLALKNKNYFKKILAVTFTNKAAEEMKSRILDLIHQISIGKEIKLIKEFSDYYKVSQDEIINRSKNLKSNILHNYSYFSITTIDAFFYSIVQSFTRDLKFRGNFNIDIDIELVINDIVDSLLSKIKKGSELSNWLIDFSKEKINQGKDFLIKEELKKMSKNLFSEDYKSLESKIPLDNHLNIIKDLRDETSYIINSFEKKILKDSESIYNLIINNNFSVSDFKYGNNGIAGFLKSNSSGNLKYPTKRIIECIDTPENWISKGKKDNIIISFISNNLNERLKNLIAFFESEYPKYNTSLLIRNNIYSYAILRELEKEVREYRDTNEVILISDIAELLFQIIKDDSIPFVFEKVGNTYNNFLIDEFQDTSSFQWKNFRQIIDESLSSGNENIIVGDIKQSIYRWRGSDSNIMDKNIYNEIQREFSDTIPLNKNWRSGSQIVNFNNYVFTNISKFLDNTIINKHINKIYNSKNVPQISRDDMKNKGYVEIQFNEKNENKLQAQTFTINSIKKIQDFGYSAGDIGILVRDNNDAKIIAECLIKESDSSDKYNFNHVSAEALDINSSPIVIFLISTINYLSHKKDRLSLSEIVNFYSKYILSSKDNSHFLLSNEEKLNLLPKDFSEKQYSLSRLPLYDLIEEIIRIFDLNKLKSQAPYLQAFMDLVLEYKMIRKGNKTLFLDWFEKNSKKLNMTSETDSIQLITIHKSKGLQFNFVIIPFFDWPLDSSSISGKTKTLWVNLKDFNKKYDMPYPINYSSNDTLTIFNSSNDREKKKAYEDSINLMYVSFTRPKLGLFINGEVYKDKVKNVSHLLFKVLSKSINNRNYINGAIEKNNNSYFGSSYFLKDFPSFSWKNRIVVRRSFDSDFREEGASRGEKIHKILSNIKNYNDIDNGVKISVEKNERKTFLQIIENLITDDKIRNFFNPKYKSFNELEILDEKGNVFRIDRVVESKNEIIVIDYKTGHEKKPEHLKQVNNYMRLLSKIYEKKIRGFLIYIDLKKIFEVL